MYQELFVDEARAMMGQPGIKDIHALLGKNVELTLSDRKEKIRAKIVAIVGDRIIIQSELPWRSIETITPV